MGRPLWGSYLWQLSDNCGARRDRWGVFFPVWRASARQLLGLTYLILLSQAAGLTHTHTPAPRGLAARRCVRHAGAALEGPEGALAELLLQHIPACAAEARAPCGSRPAPQPLVRGGRRPLTSAPRAREAATTCSGNRRLERLRGLRIDAAASDLDLGATSAENTPDGTGAARGVRNALDRAESKAGGPRKAQQGSAGAQRARALRRRGGKICRRERERDFADT